METWLLNLDRELVMIPSLAIHMDRSVNEGHAYNKQVDTLPILAGEGKEPGVMKELAAQELGVSKESI